LELRIGGHSRCGRLETTARILRHLTPTLASKLAGQPEKKRQMTT